MVRPVCFMVMPYGRKLTQVKQGKGPAEVNFNMPWDKVFVPVIEALGYEPVRADQRSAGSGWRCFSVLPLEYSPPSVSSGSRSGGTARRLRRHGESWCRQSLWPGLGRGP